MITEITKAVIAVLIIAGAIYAAILNLPGLAYLTGIAGIVIGSYFGKASLQAFGAMFKKDTGTHG